MTEHGIKPMRYLEEKVTLIISMLSCPILRNYPNEDWLEQLAGMKEGVQAVPMVRAGVSAIPHAD